MSTLFLQLTQDLMSRIEGWRTIRMVDHYDDLAKTVQSGHSIEVLSSSSFSSPDVPRAIASYKALNELTKFTPVFPFYYFTFLSLF